MAQPLQVYSERRGIFRQRRAYQRKLAVADFDGVCSGDIYVFEPKNSKLLPEFLPFICQTDNFFEYAIGTSAGSLSPTTNWKSLAKYEFALPPMEEQRRIACVLESIEMTVGKLHIFIDSSFNLQQAISDQ
jgi:type I restriction enzyme, S subunit